MQAGSINPLLTLGRWDEALATARTVIADEHLTTMQLVVVELVPAAGALVRRGDTEGAKAFLAQLPDAADSENVQNRAAQQAVLAAIARAEGRPREALDLARRAFASHETLGLIAERWKLPSPCRTRPRSTSCWTSPPRAPGSTSPPCSTATGCASRPGCARVAARTRRR